MRLIFITPSYKPAFVYGGPTMSVAKLCEVLSVTFNRSKDFILEVLTTTANGTSELPQSDLQQLIDGVSVRYYRRLTKDHSHFSPFLLAALNRSLKKGSGHSIIHIQAWWNLVSVLSCILALVRRTPVILSPRGTLSQYSFNNRSGFLKKSFHLLLGRRLLRQLHFHVTSEKEKEDILRLVSPKSIIVIPNFVDLPHLSDDPEKLDLTKARSLPGKGESSAKTTRLLFLSRIEEKKGLKYLFQALSLLDLPWTLSVAGDGKPDYIRRLQSLARDLKIDNRVTWMGHLNNEEKFSVLESHDLLVLPSYDENFANVVIESIAMGTPVLISDKVGLADYVLKYKLGMVCKQDPQSIRDSLTNFIRAGHIENLHFQDRIKQDFNECRLAQQYIKLYKSLT